MHSPNLLAGEGYARKLYVIIEKGQNFHPSRHQVVADVRFSHVDKFSNVYKPSNGAYLNLATVLGPQKIEFEAL